MSQATRPNDRHIIWSNQNLDVDDWREDYKEFLEANELDADPNDEQALYEWMEETNYDYLSDERVNLNVQLSQPIIVIGDIGRWNGRVMGYKDIPSGNIRDCLYADTDYTEWYATLEKMAGRDWRKDNLVSLAGVYLPKERIGDSTTPAALVKYLNEKPQIKKIFLHFDNDNAGRKASLALKTILPSKYEVIDSPPPCGKDYNDFLCFQLGIHRNKTKERTNER